ncbi:alpha/beta hydrolase [Streptomyces sp. NRRL S-350]|uniref:alpha/beta hydrolase n=1 Tax=Streptomyces sp. NRRL S-350 TaxID=1463902 RepID=UPI00068F1823|nr:alpha/beta fold hydrolase [Streptomyces sp. NRRL S-350]
MTTAAPRTRSLVLDAGGIPLSALVAEPEHTAPKAVILAIHGRGMRAAYFAGPAHPDTSLLTLAADLGYTVLAVDRPGHRASAHRLPHGQLIADQGATVHAALTDYARAHPVGAGVQLLAHSFGGKIALHLAAHWPHHPRLPLLGADINGLAQHYAPGAWEHPDDLAGGGRLNWGPLHLYPPGTFHAARTLLTPVPALESRELATWPERYRTLAARVRVPVRLTLAEHEHWWRLDTAARTALTAAFPPGLARLTTARGAGHNLSLGHAARPYHLRALAFTDDCLTHRPTPAPAAPAAPADPAATAATADPAGPVPAAAR